MAISPQIVLSYCACWPSSRRRSSTRNDRSNASGPPARLSGSPTDWSSTRGDEVDQLLHRTQQVRLQILKPAHRAGDVVPRLADIKFPAQCGDDALLHGVPTGIVGHLSIPTALGFTACQMSTNGWPRTSTEGSKVVRASAASRDSLLPGTR